MRIRNHFLGDGYEYVILLILAPDRPCTIEIAHDGFDLKKLESGPFDVIIGPYSVVEHAARQAEIQVRAVASLTDPDGCTDTRGSFLVRADSPVKTLNDLRGKHVLFGPPEVAESHAAAIAALKAGGVEVPTSVDSEEHHSVAALSVVTKEADVAVLPAFGWRRVVGCGTVPDGLLKVIDNTDPVPFTTVWVTDAIDRDAEWWLRTRTKTPLSTCCVASTRVPENRLDYRLSGRRENGLFQLAPGNTGDLRGQSLSLGRFRASALPGSAVGHGRLEDEHHGAVRCSCTDMGLQFDAVGDREVTDRQPR